MDNFKTAEEYLNDSLDNSGTFMDAGQKRAALNAMREFYKQALSDVYGLLFQFGEVSVDNLDRLFKEQYPLDAPDDITLYNP